MKKLLGWIVLIAALAALPAACAAEPAAEEAEWTVLVYFCGSDLESKYAYATSNLAEIGAVSYPFDYRSFYSEEDSTIAAMMRDIGKVNILIETGGSRKWHAQSLGMDVSTESLQRWQMKYIPETEGGNYVPTGGIELVETLPLRNMCDSETLSDFIRWAAREYPAKKTALVLWGHGGGAMTGMFVDELFGNDIMYLSELEQALNDGGVQLETVVIDACVMASIETARVVSRHARWMVASEEIVPGKGTAIGDWLQALVSHPALDGEWLGRCVCDMTVLKYTNEEDEMAQSLLTWSVIDLTKIERLTGVMERFFREAGEFLRNNLGVAKIFSQHLYKAEEYGESNLSMRDLGSVIYNPEMISISDGNMLDEMMEALSEAVEYVVRGGGRSLARGLSFCYPAGQSKEELNAYARNYPMSCYLAYLDAISPEWDAPEWVYGQTDRLPGIETIGELQISIEKQMTADGIPALYFGTTLNNLDDLCYRLYRRDENTGEIVRLGRTDCGAEVSENGMLQWRPEDLFHWPAVEGTICCADLIRYSGDLRLYNIPVQIGTDTSILRCGREMSFPADGGTPVSEYEVYGVWEGYDENSELANRGVKPLAMLAGQRYRLLYPAEGTGPEAGKTFYETSADMTMYLSAEVMDIPLPPGTYYMEYELKDLFMRTMRMEMIEFSWDGQKMTFPEGFTWEGMVEPEWGG